MYSILTWISQNEKKHLILQHETNVSVLKEFECFDLLHDTGCRRLDTTWSLHNMKGNNNVSIMIGVERTKGSLVVHSLLHEHGIIQDPAYGWNEMHDAWVKEDIWTFEVRFIMPRDVDGIVMENIDTFGRVEMDGVFLRNTSNMHRSYYQNVLLERRDAHEWSNVLSITLYSAVSVTEEMHAGLPYAVPHTMHLIHSGHYNLARKSAVDFGWDFAPAFVPAGLLGPLTLIQGHCHVFMEHAIVRQEHDVEGVVVLDIDVWFRSKSGIHDVCGSISVDVIAPPGIGAQQSQRMHAAMDLGECRMICPRQIKEYDDCMWKCHGPRMTIQHPVLWGTWDQDAMTKQQPLYSVWVQFKQNGCSPERVDNILCPIQEKKNIKIGLRSFDLVRRLLGKRRGESFFFKLNGQKLYSKGSNLVPLHIFRDQIHDNAIERLIWSAKNAHFNTIRVWGGGEYLPDKFYDVADEAGILVWQEFAFACALYPTNEKFLVDVSVEVQQQALRIANHPSVVLYGFNNENENAFEWFDESIMNPPLYAVDYHVLFIETIRTVLLEIDDRVQYVDSSPSNGVMRTDPSLYVKRWGDVGNEAYGDVHFYEYGQNLLSSLDVYPKARFISEFGFMSLPSWRLFKNQIPQEEASLADFLTYRTRRYNGLVELVEQMRYHFFSKSCIINSAALIKRLDWQNIGDFVYLTQLQQGLIYRQAAAAWRRAMLPNATMGFLYWQFADIGGWSGSSWSTLDSDMGWKVSHYFVRDFFAPIALTVEQTANHVDISVSSHEIAKSKIIDIQVDVVPYNAVRPTDVQTVCRQSSIRVLPCAFDHICRAPVHEPSEAFLLATIHESDRFSQHAWLLEEPIRSSLPSTVSVSIDSVDVSKADPTVCPHHTHMAIFKASSTAVALFVTLESSRDDVHFLENAMTVLPWETATFRACANSSSIDPSAVTIMHLQDSVQTLCSS